MENIIGIIITDKSVGSVAFLTWGRVFDRVDSEPLLHALKKIFPKYGLHKISNIRVCYSLQEVAGYMYFYENLALMSGRPIPIGKKHAAWAARTKRAIIQGKELYFLGEQKEKHFARYRKQNKK